MTDHITIGDVRPWIQYAANGTQTVFPFPFPVFLAGELEVHLGEARQETGYTIAGAGLSDGGSVAFDAAPAAGAKVTLSRRLTLERTADFQESGAFRAKVINDQLDRLVASVQQVADDVQRCARYPVTASDRDPWLPRPEPGRPLAWNDDGSALVNGATRLDDVAAAAAAHAASAAASAIEATARAEDANAFMQGAEAVSGLDLAVIDRVVVASGDVLDVCLYDTRGDSDGGAWRRRTSHASWSAEPLNTTVRGTTRDFPAIVAVVATSSTVTLYDLTRAEAPMWMVFTVGGVLLSPRQPVSVRMAEGLLAIGARHPVNGDDGALHEIDFVTDRIARRNHNALYHRTNTIAQRNQAPVTFDSDSDRDLVHSQVRAVAAAVVPGTAADPVRGLPRPTLVAATEGGIAVVHGDGAVSAFGGDDGRAVALSAGGDLAAVNGTAGSLDVFRAIATPGDRTGPSVRYDTASVPALLAAPRATARAVAATADGFALASAAGLSVINERADDPASGLVAHVTSAWATPLMQGAAVLCLAGDAATDRSAAATPLTDAGTAGVEPVVSGGELTALRAVGGAITAVVPTGGAFYGWEEDAGVWRFRRGRDAWNGVSESGGTLTIADGTRLTRLVYVDGPGPDAASLDRIEHLDRPLLAGGALLLLGGDTVDAVAWDGDTDRLFVAGPAGTSVFRGLQRVAAIDDTGTPSSNAHRAVDATGGAHLIATAAEVAAWLPALPLRESLATARPRPSGATTDAASPRLSAHAAVDAVAVRHASILDVFLYDTSRDEDGGAWRRRCARASWWREPLETATRGAARDFPALVLAVATPEAVTLYDATDPTLPMWMVFAVGGILLAGRQPEAVVLRDGRMVIGAPNRSGGSGGIHEVDFAADCIRRRYSSGLYRRGNDVAHRNEPAATAAIDPAGAIPGAETEGIAISVAPGASTEPASGRPRPTLAVAAEAGVAVVDGDGGVSVLAPGAAATDVVVTRRGDVAFANAGQGSLDVVRVSGAAATYGPATAPALLAAPDTARHGLVEAGDALALGSAAGITLLWEDRREPAGGFCVHVTAGWASPVMPGGAVLALGGESLADRSPAATLVTDHGSATVTPVVVGAELAYLTASGGTLTASVPGGGVGYGWERIDGVWRFRRTLAEWTGLSESGGLLTIAAGTRFTRLVYVDGPGPSAAWLERIETLERPLVNGAPCRLAGGADAVAAVAWDPATARLAVAGPGGTSVFCGLARVEHWAVATRAGLTDDDHRAVAAAGGALAVASAAEVLVSLPEVRPRAPAAAVSRGDGPLVFDGATADDAATVIGRFGLAEGETAAVDLGAVAAAGDGSDTRGLFRRQALVHRPAAGDVTVQGAVVTVGSDVATDLGLDATLVANPGQRTVDVVVTGKAATVLAWTASVRVTRIGRGPA